MIYLKPDITAVIVNFSICRARLRIQTASPAPKNLSGLKKFHPRRPVGHILQVYNYPQGKICEA